MGNRIFTAVVLLLWTATMSWLVVARILPPFFQGEPPYLGALKKSQITCWQIECAGAPVGWAVSQVVPAALGTTEIHSRILLEDIPIREMAPGWMISIMDKVGPIRLDTRNRIALDSLGKLSGFDNKVRLNELPSVIKMYGRVEDAKLRVSIQSGDVKHNVEYPTPSKSLLGGELTPDARLTGMYVGRKWQKEVYSPFRSPHRSVEWIQAEVVAEESVLFNGELTTTRRVEYRSLSSAGVAADDTLRARLWVAEDGTVLRQDVFFLNVKLRFDRRLDAESLAHAGELLDLKSVATTIHE